jgi:hypothetical protein
MPDRSPWPALGAAWLLLCFAVACSPSAAPGAPPSVVPDQPGATPQRPAGAADGPGISVSEALATDLTGPLLVNGYVVITAEETRLCEALAESHPPQCAGASVPVSGLDPTALGELESAAGVRWTAQPTQLLGDLVDGTLVVGPTQQG